MLFGRAVDCAHWRNEDLVNPPLLCFALLRPRLRGRDGGGGWDQDIRDEGG